MVWWGYSTENNLDLGRDDDHSPAYPTIVIERLTWQHALSKDFKVLHKARSTDDENAVGNVICSA